MNSCDDIGYTINFNDYVPKGSFDSTSKTEINIPILIYRWQEKRLFQGIHLE